MPGVAGLILTLAVALDANVLIYERMREEAKAGRQPALAIDAGFNRAMLTIFDANITHLGAAFIMLNLAPPGPVKGFAWTLLIGVFTSVFTAVLITQVLVAWWFRTDAAQETPDYVRRITHVASHQASAREDQLQVRRVRAVLGARCRCSRASPRSI